MIESIDTPARTRPNAQSALSNRDSAKVPSSECLSRPSPSTATTSQKQHRTSETPDLPSNLLHRLLHQVLLQACNRYLPLSRENPHLIIFPFLCHPHHSALSCFSSSSHGMSWSSGSNSLRCPSWPSSTKIPRTLSRYGRWWPS